MGRIRNRRFRLTFCGRERRWRKIYRGKPHHFPLLPGETKESSYPRCMELWEQQKAKIDAEAYDPHREQWEALLERQVKVIDECKQRDEDLRNEYEETHWTERGGLSEQLRENREAWRTAFFVAESIRANLKAGTPFPSTSGLGELKATYDGVELRKKQPVLPRQETEISEQLGRNVELFLQQKAVEISPNTADKLKGNLARFTEHFGETRTVKSLDSHALSEFRTCILQRIQRGEITDTYGADLLKAAKQFFRWILSRRDDFTLPNILLSGWGINVELKETKVFTCDEIRTLLADPPPRVRCFTLLALNCGMLACDIADLRQSEIRDGRIIRKRTKTRRERNTPTVSYLLWEETKDSLEREMSNGERVFPTRSESVRRSFRKHIQRIGIPGSFKLLRASGANLLRDHKDHRVFQDLYLGHAPASMSERHYSTSDAGQAEFDAAVEYLRDCIL